MSWEEEIDELRRRETLAKKMGGPDKVKRQRDGGKLTVRERVDRLLDKDSFHEIGALAGWAKYGEDGELADFTPANLIFGRGRIAGRAVAITGDDFRVRGGANDGGIKQKLLAVERMACDLRLPLVRLVDGTGGGGSVKNLELQGHSPMPKAFLWDWWTDNLAEVPVVSLALGSVAGLGAARVAASHYSVMADARRRALRHRGNHRSARHAPDSLRVCRAGGAAAHPRPQCFRRAPLALRNR